MSNDIVHRLRHAPLGNMYAHQSLMEEAADEIERLREAKRRALALADERAKELVRRGSVTVGLPES
jgi:hypothetical protein